MARVTRLELAASAVTGRRSNQLSYTRASEVGVFYQGIDCPVNVDFDLISEIISSVNAIG